jgi:hypothetical protein
MSAFPRWWRLIPLATLLTTQLGAQTPAEERSRDMLAESLRRSAATMSSLELLGDEVVRAVLHRAASDIRTGRTSSLDIELPVTLRIIPAAASSTQDVPRPPTDASGLDVCWQITVGWRAYVNCAYNPPRVTVQPLRTCAVLRAEFDAAPSSRSRWLILQEMLARGCVTWSAVQLTLDRPSR